MLVIASPGLAMALAYVALDPFRVLRSYDDYYANNPVVMNRDWVSTSLYEQRATAAGYDTFVFGSSRSLSIRCDDWVVLASGSHCFHYDAWSETLFGIAGKINLIDRSGLPLRRALIVIDQSVLDRLTNSTGHLFRKHPDVSGEGMIGFEAESFSAFFSNLFVIKFVDYRLFGRFRPYMDQALDDHGWRQNPTTNDLSFTLYDDAVASEGEKFWSSRPAEFTRVAPSPAPARINGACRRMLETMAEVFRKKGTIVQIVVPPLFDQQTINAEDLERLRSTFGPDTIHDYSGVNAITADYHNYYDRSHFRPSVGRTILADLGDR